MSAFDGKSAFSAGWQLYTQGRREPLGNGTPRENSAVVAGGSSYDTIQDWFL